jgi:hypothetical protein
MLEIGSLSAMKKRFEFLGTKPSDECGCPEEDWVIDMFNVTIHLEPVTGGDIFIDCGDWQDEKTGDCTTIEELRCEAVKWIKSIPHNNEL